MYKLKIFFGIIALNILLVNLKAQISLTSSGYIQNFNSYAGSATTLPSGWTQTSDYGATYRGTGDGSGGGSNSGGFWAYGNTEYSLGNLSSNSTGTITHSVSFQNSTSTAITSLQISYDFEQWRFGQNTLGFIVSGTGALSSQNLSSLSQSGITTGINGRVRVVTKSLVISNLNILPGQTFGIQWQHNNGAQNDNGIAIDNFMIGNVILPVELKSFTTQTANDKVLIIWETASEVSAAHFTVERLGESNTQCDIVARKEAVGQVEGAHYEVIDEHPCEGNNYYRLKMTDIDGSFTYSSIQSVTIQVDEFSLFPSLTANTIHLKIPVKEKVECRISGMNGELMAYYSQLESGALDISNLPAGTYIVHLLASGAVHTFTFVKYQ